MNYLYIDKETRSQTDLNFKGGMAYAQCPSTELIVVCYAFGDAPIKTHFIEDGPLPAHLLNYLNSNNPDDKIVAHYATFERLFLEHQGHKYGVHDIDLTRWVCSSATAMAVGLPSSLKDLAIALDLPTKKMSEGTRLIKEYCCPGFLTEWKPGDKSLMGDYCESDVEVMRLAMQLVPALSPDMLRQYHICEDMNDQGVPVDLEFAHAALTYSEDIRSDVNNQIRELTDGAVDSFTARKNRDVWLREQLSDEQLDTLMVKGKLKFDQLRRTALLDREDIPQPVRLFTEQVESAGGATIAKYQSMVNTAVNGRVHGSIIWSGAGASGRYASRGLQLQNMKRDVMPAADQHIKDVIEGYEIPHPADTLARLVRASITSPHGITWSDFSQIEARVLPWLSADKRADDLLEAFSRGDDIYTREAMHWFKTRDVAADQRQAAKVGVLACGFQGGYRAVQAMARGYGMSMTDEEANSIKEQWRAANPWAETLWKGLGMAAENAVKYPGTVCKQGRMAFLHKGEWLWLLLPSGRCLGYYQPKFEELKAPWEDEPSLKLTALWGAGKRKVGEAWPRRALYGGLFAQNATQGTAADIMREAITRAYDAGLNILFPVHDELVCEGYVEDELHAVMLHTPDWAGGLPISADTKSARRYGK